MASKKKFRCRICGTTVTEGAVPIRYTPTCNNKSHRKPQLMEEETS